MTRSRMFLGLVLVATALPVVSAWAQPKDASPSGGPRHRAFGGPGMGGGGFGLLRVEQVQKDLQLTDEQKEKLQALAKETRENRENLQSKLAEILKPAQIERLKQIRMQVEGPLAILQPDVAKDLDLTEEQRGKIKATFEQSREKMQEAFKDLSPDERQAKRAEMREKMLQMRKEHMEKVLEVLTPQQREKFEKLKGAKLDLDLSKLWQPGPGGGRHGEGRKPQQ